MQKPTKRQATLLKFIDNYTIEKNHKGDLWQLIYPSWNKMDENVIYQKEHEFHCFYYYIFFYVQLFVYYNI